MEYPDIPSIGSLELIDRLIIISDSEDIGIFRIYPSESGDEPELSVIGILILIDHDPLVLLGECRAHDLIRLDEMDCSQYHI